MATAPHDQQSASSSSTDAELDNRWIEQLQASAMAHVNNREKRGIIKRLNLQIGTNTYGQRRLRVR
jgi:hypothetical protein